jgi:hypothetical protein
MTTRSGPLHAWCAQVWGCVRFTAQVLAGCGASSQLTGWWPPQDLGIPERWSDSTVVTDEPGEVMTVITPHSMLERTRGFTPVELARLHVLRARNRATCAPLTTREVARLHFVRWMHQTGRITP